MVTPVDQGYIRAPADNASWTTHVQGCSRCCEKLALVDELNTHLTTAHKTLDRGHDEARDRLLADLPANVGQADKQLGTKEINGRKVEGFVIDTKKIDPDAQPGPTNIWVDSETSLPFEIEITYEGGQVPMTLKLIDFEWNTKLDDSVFAIKIPDGYTDNTPKPKSPKEQVADIAIGLNLYAELSGGHYPKGKMVYGDVTRDEMMKMAGFEGQPTPKQLRERCTAEFKK